MRKLIIFGLLLATPAYAADFPTPSQVLTDYAEKCHANWGAEVATLKDQITTLHNANASLNDGIAALTKERDTLKAELDKEKAPPK